MYRAAAVALRLIVTLALCAACWWIWSTSFSLAAMMHVGELDLVVRILAIFVALSLADVVQERLVVHE